MVATRSDILQNVAEELGNFLKTYQSAFSAFFGFVVVSLIIIMILNITKLSRAGDNAEKRSEAIRGILVTGVCITIMGSIGFVYLILIGILIF